VKSEFEHMTAEDRALIIEEAKTRVPTCTYCRYNVDHVFKTIKERETHEEVCPERAAYERKAAKTSEIYNRHKNYIEQVRDNKREKNAKFDISNAPSATNFPLLKYKYVMNEPFVAGTSAQNQWSHEQLTFKRKRDLEIVGVRNDGLCRPQPPIQKTEDQVKQERQDLWDSI
jgi:DNA polymerase II small subunit/DNA polymerase delta subunit B